MKFNKHTIYIGLFAILYLIVAFSSFWHACAFFGLANNEWMSIILAFAFEVGQASVLFSLLTSVKDRSRVMPWVLMTMFTLVQVIGNIYSSYKYIIINSVENLRYFKEPIFIWTDLPDAQANVIIVYLVGALLPIASLLLTSMITNYLTDNEVENDLPILSAEINSEKGPNPPINIKDKEEFDKVYNEEIEQLKKQIEELNNKKDGESGEITTEESKPDNNNGGQQMGTDEDQTTTESPITENIKPKIDEIPNETTGENSIKTDGSETKLEGDKSEDGGDDLNEDVSKRPSHFINI